MNGARSHFGRIKAGVLLAAVICLQFCATTCALGNCTSSTAKRVEQVAAKRVSEHCHQHSDQGNPPSAPKSEDPSGCHSANEVIAAFTDNGNVVGGNNGSHRTGLAVMPANTNPLVETALRNFIKPLPFESPPKRAVITALRI